jgi:hypothetical protein
MRHTLTPTDEQSPTEILKSRPRNHRRWIRAEGTPIKFQLCIGEYGTKTVLDCEGQYYYGNA